MNKKKILALALAVCLLGTVSYSTLAWFNASQTVTNKFMVATTGSGAGGSNQPAEKVFSLDLYEVVDKNGDGTVDPDTEKVAYRSDAALGWDYEDILPGVAYHKEPIVENTGSYEQFVRVVVTVTNANAWKLALSEAYGTDKIELGEIFLNHSETEWVRAEILDPGVKVRVPLGGGSTQEETDTISYVYYLNRKLAPGQTATVFTDVQLPARLTQEHMAWLAKLVGTSYELEFAIDVRADAIQTKGFTLTGDTVAEQAQSAFAGAGWAANKTYAESVTP